MSRNQWARSPSRLIDHNVKRNRIAVRCAQTTEPPLLAASESQNTQQYNITVAVWHNGRAMTKEAVPLDPKCF
uniref:Uncharacterized protein n=5 Tax=Oryza TaxID=4527 RepID=Q337S1_ORYSJ|nr:hypothetical protein LOC_Os10g30900 [Oryza sativa Japonica Group]